MADVINTKIKTNEQSKRPPDLAKIKIIESVLSKQTDVARGCMNATTMNRLMPAVDDFCIGYSSLSFLKPLPFDQLKVDPSFTQGISVQKNDLAIVKGIIMMADGLGLNIIAEGAETELQISILKQHGCKQFQGYFFSKPLPLEKFIHYLQEQSIEA